MSRFNFKPFLIGVGILAVGVIGLIILIGLRPEPEKEERRELAPLVETVSVERATGSLTVSGSGTVSARRQVALSSEVAGRIVSASEDFVNGGAFEKGQILIELDSTDYVNAVSVARAEVTARKYEAIVAREESQIAKDEWERLKRRDPDLKPPKEGEMGSLVFREPQIVLADAAVAAAEARLNDSLRRLERSRIRAPFDGRILSRQAELGQYLAPGMVVASFYSTDIAEIVVALRTDQAELLGDIPGLTSDRIIQARVMTGNGAGLKQWDGKVVRTEGALDPTTRTIRLVVQVDDPYGLNSGKSPLLVGSYASVVIAARDFDGESVIPRPALRDNDQVWVVDNETVSIRNVDVLTAEQGTVYLSGGLMPGDRVVVSSLAVVTEGMGVREVEGSRSSR